MFLKDFTEFYRVEILNVFYREIYMYTYISNTVTLHARANYEMIVIYIFLDTRNFFNILRDDFIFYLASFP